MRDVVEKLVSFVVAAAIVGGAIYGLLKASHREVPTPAAAPASEAAVGVLVEPSAPQPDINVLRIKCADEVRRNVPLAERTNCSAFAAHSRNDTMNVVPYTPPSASYSRPEETARTTEVEEREPQVHVPDCRATHEYGTIKYRECRAYVSRQLRKQCSGAEAHWNEAVGERRQNAKLWARAICREADRYQIVD